MYSVNIELTNMCPLRCPQCYCGLEGDKYINLETAKSKINEAAEHGVKAVNLSGGETLCYPWLYELAQHAAARCEQVNVAISGYYFNELVLERMLDSGITSISVSLNGSTKSINSLTRDGYELAIKALELLGKSTLKNKIINWVMHSNNCEDFPNIVALAENLGIAYIDVIMFKPDSKHELRSFPSGKQIKIIADYIRNYKGKVTILVEPCFSQLRALIGDYGWLGNFNTGAQKGCGAGLHIYNITVDGNYSPCRHLVFDESYSSLNEFLEKSPFVQKLEKFEEDLRQPCAQCNLQRYCRPCAAIPAKLHGAIYKGHENCEVWQLNESPALEH